MVLKNTKMTKATTFLLCNALALQGLLPIKTTHESSQMVT